MKACLERAEERMGVERLDTVSIDSSFQEFCCKGEQNMGPIAGEKSRFKRRLWLIF